MRRALILVLCGGVALAAGLPLPTAAEEREKAKPDEAAVKRARKTVRMLDDIYKTAIVLITDKYVKTKKDYPAGRAAIKWLNDVGKKGWPKTRLIDVSGDPYSPKNVADDDFEKEGVKQLKAGKDYYDKVVTEDGKTYLRAVTAIPVVSKRCIMCHENYKEAKKGAAVGALSYTVPVE
jgi:Protein of unknown function (DUF3365)